jgi:hypothetical protein
MPPHEEMIKFFRDEKIIFQFSSVGAGVTITPVSRNGKTIPGVSVYSGRNMIGTAPGNFSLTPSDNRLVLKREGFKELKLKVNPNLNLNLNPVMEVDRYRPFKGLAITGFVVGGVSLFAGVIAYGVASGMNAFSADADTAYIVSYSLMGIGIGGIVLGAVFISIKRPVPGSEGFAIDVSGNGAKLSYTYKF